MSVAYNDTITLVSESLISNLTVASGKAYEIVENGLRNEAIVYIEAKYKKIKYSTLPTWLEGTTYIKTAYKDADSGDASLLTFDVDRDVTVYVAHDDRITMKPSWLISFTDTGDNLVTTDTIFSVFASNFLAGTVTLGGNLGTGGASLSTVLKVKGQGNIKPTVLPSSKEKFSMYSVIIVGQ